MTLGTVKALAQELGFHMGEAELAEYHDALMPSIGAYNAIDRMAQELPPATGRPATTTRTTPGTSGPRSRARRAASSRANGSRSRTTCASPGCR